jgi:hypothetical protein
MIRTTQIGTLTWQSSDPTAPLDTLAREASDMAETIFNGAGGVPIVWVCEAPGKGKAQIVTKINVPDGTPDAMRAKVKNKLVKTIRKMFGRHGVTRYAMAHEAWLGTCMHTDDERWSRFPGQNGGLAKVVSGFDYAASFSCSLSIA